MEEPTYTTIRHEIRKKFRISADEYCLADSIHKLSNRVDFPWCKLNKADLGKFIGISERSVYRKTAKLAKKGLIEQNDEGLRSTPLWRDTAEMYDKMSSAKVAKSSAKVATPSIYNNNTNKKENTASPFSLKEELGKLKGSPQRHIQLIGEYLEEIGYTCSTLDAFKVAMGRHFKDAAALAKFTDSEIGRATDYAQKEYKKTGYNLGTLVKIITSNSYAKK